jgi:FRG domain
MPSFKTITVTSWDDIVKKVRQARDMLGATDDEECFFRGLSDMKFELLPTLHRKTKELDWSDALMLEKEDAFFWEFQARAHELHGLSFDDWDYLFAMRHHGVPTRLLDWTESLGVALYFAVKSDTGTATKRPCIWVLNPYSLNQKAGWGRDLVAPRYLGWDQKEQTFIPTAICSSNGSLIGSGPWQFIQCSGWRACGHNEVGLRCTGPIRGQLRKLHPNVWFESTLMANLKKTLANCLMCSDSIDSLCLPIWIH